MADDGVAGAGTGGRAGRGGSRLGWLVAANLVASGAHFAHNAIFLDTYPGPPWIPGPGFVVAAWCAAALVLVSALLWYRLGRVRLALAGVLAYGAVALLVFGHYLYGPPADFDLLTNALIWLEGTGGAVLLAYFVPRALRELDAG